MNNMDELIHLIRNNEALMYAKKLKAELQQMRQRTLDNIASYEWAEHILRAEGRLAVIKQLLDIK